MKRRLPTPMTHFDLFGLEEDWSHINGDPISDSDTKDKIREFVFNDFRGLETCPYCSKHLLTADFDSIENMQGSGHYSVLWSCGNCAYWQCYLVVYSECPPTSFTSWYAYISKVRSFDERMPEVCNAELAQAIRRKQEIWHTINPNKLERLVADIFKGNYSECEVMHVGKPDDGGVDVIFVDSEKQQWLIQVKRRENPLSSEGVTTIRNLLGTMIVEGALHGVVVSTADHFTVRAYEAVRRARKNHSLEVRLVDRGKLNRMLEPLLPKKPWLAALKTEVPASILSKFSRKISESLKPDTSKQLSLWEYMEEEAK